METPTIIFDLDGTLIDSSTGILASLETAFRNEGISPLVPFSNSIIGPSLQDILLDICPSPTMDTIDRLSASFKYIYDNVGCVSAEPFPGVNEMITALSHANISVHIATNKRIYPTLRILDVLGWTGFFAQVLSPDSFNPPLSTKQAVLASLIREDSLDPLNCCYIGDRFDDYKAAKVVGIPFVLAEWGFEEDGSVFPPGTMRMKSPDAEQLITYLIERDCR